MTRKTLIKLYRTAYIVGVAMIVASLALMLPGVGNINRASAQTGWFITLYCDGFDLDAPEHPDINIRVRARGPNDAFWGYDQSWPLGAGGPATYSFEFDPLPPPGSEVLIRVFAAADNTTLFNFKDDLPCGEVTPTNTPVTPTNTPVTPTNTPVTPTDTPVTPTSTSTISIPTFTSTPTSTNTPTETSTPTNSPTVTPTGTLPTNTPTFTASPTVTGTLPTPTFTPTSTSTFTPTPTQTDVSSIPTPTPPRDPRPSNTPQSSIPSPAPQGTPGVLIPETGLDLNAQFSFMQRSLLNMGLGFLGLGLVLQGMALNAGRKEE